MSNGGPEPFGCHYLTNVIAVPFAQKTQAETSLTTNNFNPVEVQADVLAEAVMQGRVGLAEANQILNVVTVFEVSDDPLTVSQTVRDTDGVDASPIHAVGFMHHIYVKPGTDATPTAGSLSPVRDSDTNPRRIIAIVDSGIVHPELLPTWMQPANTRFDIPDDIEVLDDPLAQVVSDDPVYESHGTFVAGLIRQISPAHTVSVARAKRVSDLDTFMPPPPDHWLAPLPTTELDVLAAIERLITRHEGEQVEALNLSLGAYSCAPAGDWLLVTLAEALVRWTQAHPECRIFAAGGNIPGDVPLWPAAYPFVHAVAAAANNGAQQVVWDPTNQEQPADPRWWISDVGPGSNVVNLSGQPEEHLVVWSGSSFASPIVAALKVSSTEPIWNGLTFWWPAKPVDYTQVAGLSFQ